MNPLVPTTRPAPRLGVAAALCLSCAASGAATVAESHADTESAAELATVAVNATAVERREQRLRRVKHQGSSATVTRDRIEQSNVVGSEDLLRYAPNLTIRSRYIGDRNALIGGRSNSSVQGSRSLVYVDGLLISDLLGATFNPPRWGMVSPSEIQSVDVLYGPFAAELPGNSMGTTVQITTRYPRALQATGDTQYFRQTFADAYGFADDYSGYRANSSLGQSRDHWRWFISAGHLDTTSHPMQYATPTLMLNAGVAALPLLSGNVSDRDPQNLPREILGPTGIEDTVQDNAKFKLAVDLADAATLEFVLGYWSNDYARRSVSLLHDATGAPVYTGDWRLADGRGIRIAPSTFSPQRGNETHWHSALSLTWQLTSDWALQAGASDYRIADNALHSALSAPPDATRGGTGTAALGDGTGWNTADAKLDGELASHHVRVGAHADRYVLQQRVHAQADWRDSLLGNLINRFAGKASTAALYAQDEWRFAAQWSLTVGARFEQWRAFDGVRASGSATPLSYAPRTISAWSPKLSLGHDLGEQWTLRASTGKAVRFPTVSELFQGTISNNAIVNSDPNLRAERSYSSEIALEGHLPTAELRASVFQDDIRDSLFNQTNLSVTPSVSNIQNIGRIRNRGIELAGEWAQLGVEGLSLSANVAFNRSRILANPNYAISEGKHAPRIPAVRAAAVLSYAPDADWRFSLAARHSGRQWNTLDNSDSNPEVFGGTSRFTVFDTKLTRQLRNGFSTAVGVDNLSNQEYFVFHPYPRRTVFVELRYDGARP